jgi:hypothetical protein
MILARAVRKLATWRGAMAGAVAATGVAMRTWSIAATALVSVLSLSAGAHAQPGATPVGARDLPAAPARSESTATLLAVGATAAGFGLLALATHRDGGDDTLTSALAWSGLGLVVVGPSAGHIYAGEGGHALGFSALRLGSLAALGVGLIASLNECDVVGPCQDGSKGGARALMAAGAIGYVGLTIYDIHDASAAVRRASARALALTPAPLRTPGGRTAPGLVLAGSF